MPCQGKGRGFDSRLPLQKGVAMQKSVRKFNDVSLKNAHKKPMPVYARILDTQSEMGELAKEYLKNSNYGTKDFELTQDFEMEFGDVLYCLLSLANEVQIDAKECLDLALKKYQDRINKKNSMGSES